MAGCAALALAAILSVQQSEHGPLVVYTLETEPHGVQVPPPQAFVVIPSRAPRVLGTVTLPAEPVLIPAEPVLIPAEPVVIPAEPVAVPEARAGAVVTLQTVSDEIAWRRETAARLPKAPFAPRF